MLGLRDLILIVIGTVIGSGIFLVPGGVLRQAGGQAGPALLVWVVGGALSLLGALAYGELGAMNPAAGGLYVWLTFPQGLNAGLGGSIVKRATEAGVLYIPGEFGHVPDASGHVPKNEVRLSFGVAEPDAITEGIRRLREACRGMESLMAEMNPVATSMA